MRRPVGRARPGYPTARLLGLVLGAAPAVAAADVTIPSPPAVRHKAPKRKAPADGRARADALRFILDDDLRTRPIEAVAQAPTPMPPTSGSMARPKRPVIVFDARPAARWTPPSRVRTTPTAAPDRPLDFVDEVLGELEGAAEAEE